MNLLALVGRSMYSWCKHHSSGSEKSRGTESEALQFSFMQLSRHRRAQQRKAWQTVRLVYIGRSVGCWQLVTWVPSHPDHQKSRTDGVRMDLLLVDILNIKVANRCATHGHWKAKVSALHCLKLLKIFKWKCCILYALQIVLHAQLELIPKRSKRLSWSNTTPMDFIKAALERMRAMHAIPGRMSQGLSNL